MRSVKSRGGRFSKTFSSRMIDREGYEIGLDGLRGISVLVVLLFHLNVPGFDGGYLGVDIFFVISGYLITSIIMADIRARKFSYRKFLTRRAKRLLPALFLVTLVTAVMAWLSFGPGQLSKFGTSMVGVATYTSNFVFMLDTGYFQQSSASTPLLHTWSLGVEEQFYIIFPLLLILLAKKDIKFVLWGGIWLTSISLFFWIFLRETSISPTLANWSFFLLPMRAWELGLGAILALVHRQIQTSSILNRISAHLAWIGFFLLLVSFVLGSAYPDKGIPSLIAAIGAVFIIGFHRGTSLERVLAIPALVRLGLLSYGLYLWHYPIISFSKFYSGQEILDLNLQVVAGALSFVLAYLSLRFVENPVRNSNWRTTDSMAVSSVFVILVASTGLLAKTPNWEYPVEARAADILETHQWTYFENMDEGLFQLERLEGNLGFDPETLILGSSRIMQLGSVELESSVLNVSISGARLNHLVVLGVEGTKRTQVEKVIIGVDPWIVNKNFPVDGRYSSLPDLSEYLVMDELSSGLQSSSSPASVSKGGPIFDFHRKTTLSSYEVPTKDEPELLSKKDKYGRQIYNTTRVSKNYDPDFQDLSYAEMDDFTPSEPSKDQLIDFIMFLQEHDLSVSLLMSPYHPDLYEYIRDTDHGIIRAETMILQTGLETGAEVLGSYDPLFSGCESGEFYDGMHPKSSCMIRVVSGIR